MYSPIAYIIISQYVTSSQKRLTKCKFGHPEDSETYFNVGWTLKYTSVLAGLYNLLQCWLDYKIDFSVGWTTKSTSMLTGL